LFVTDNSRKLSGVLSLKELLIASVGQKIEDIMSKNVISVKTDDDQEDVARTLQELDLLAIPVVDNEDLIVGIITIDDAIDILEEEATEDMYSQAGLRNVTNIESERSDILITGNLLDIWKKRMPFLIITLIAGLAAAAIIGHFEETLESIAIVAAFMPIIMDMGGNVGTQSSTIFVRGMAIGQINPSDFGKYFLKETGVGFSMALIIGTITGVIAAVLNDMPMLGLAVGLALVTTMTLAALLGFLVPHLLAKANIDQAAGTGPIITSIKDISGLIVYFVLVNIFLGHLIY
jgi:magnesium transporter